MGVCQRLQHSVVCLWRRKDFPRIALIANIVGADFQQDSHQLVFGRLVAFDEDLALALEHPRNASLFTEVATVLGERMADLTNRSVAVISRDGYQHRGATWAVAFKQDFVDLAAFQLAGAAHNGPFDVIGRHADCLGSQNGGSQSGVTVGIAATPASSNHDFLNEAREDLAALGIEGSFLVLNRRPFAVSRHEKTSGNLLLTFEDIKNGK